jgi:uroporphyrinogen-III synthase
LYIHGEDVRGGLVEALKADGIALQSQVLYDQVPVDLTNEALHVLRGKRPVLLPLFSPRSADLVGRAALGATAPLAIAALSPAVAEAWSGPLPVDTVVARHPDAPAMLDAIATIYARLLA